MCRNITALRGLEPPATTEEVDAAATQFVRKVSGVTSGNLLDTDAFRQAVASVALATRQLLEDLPARRSPPRTAPASRRRAPT